jgi:endonuclease-3
MAGRETQGAKAARALAIIQALDREMPEANIELTSTTPLELLVAVLLSAQTTDKRVNLATPKLFERFKTAQDYADADVTEVESYIRTVGLFRNKAKALVRLGKELVVEHRGEVPTTRAALARLPGVGPKTAGVVSIHLGGDTAFPVDTHVLRLAKRLGLSAHANPDDVEVDLRKLVPEPWWFKGHQLLIWHGRRTCFARQPACSRCVVRALCPRRGVPIR